MKDYTTPGGLIFTPTEQCIFYALCRYYQKPHQNSETPSDGSVEAVVARWLSAPCQDLGPMMRCLQAHEDLRLEDVVYSLGDFKDFDEWIDYVSELELRKERHAHPHEHGKASSLAQVRAADVVPVAASAVALDDADEGWCLVVS